MISKTLNYKASFWLLIVSTTPRIKKERNVGYKTKNVLCTFVNDRTIAKNICKTAIIIIPIVPILKKGCNFFILLLIYRLVSCKYKNLLDQIIY